MPQAGASRLLTIALLAVLAACSERAPLPAAPDLESPRLLITSPTQKLVISQIYGGGNNSGAPLRNDFVELFNAGAVNVDLTGMSIQYASATGTGNFQTVALTSTTLQPGQYYLVQLGGGTTNGVPLPTPDATGGILASATAGKFALVNSAAALACNGGSAPCTPAQTALILDLVGFGNANYFEGSGAAPTLSNTTAGIRRLNGCTDTNNNAADFLSSAPAPRNTASPLTPCATGPSVASVVPTNGAVDVALNANLSVTFDRGVTATGAWYALSCGVSGAQAATFSGGPTTFMIDPAADLPAGETCTVTITAANVSETAAPNAPMTSDFSWNFTTVAADPCTLPYTSAYSIQGTGDATPLLNQAVTTQGVVVGDYEGASPTLRGFFLQDATGDGNPNTSDAVFVFNASNNSVSVGDVVRVRGTATEFQGQTQVGSVTSLVTCATGASVSPVAVTLPVPSPTALERFEGMLVTLPQTLYVTEHFQLGRFGQVVMSSSARLAQPTNVAAPGAAANALQAQNDLNRIIVDDGDNDENPDPIVFGRGGNPLSASNTLRGGDQATGIVGVLTYTWAGNSASGNAYRVRPVNALGGTITFVSASSRPSSPAPVGGSLRVAGMNVLNYFNTFSACANGLGGATSNNNCRGADDANEFQRQADKTVSAIVAMNADVVGLVEMENDGYGSGSALADLVGRLNSATAAGTYAFVDVDAATGQVNALGTDGIKVAVIYKPAAVTPVGKTAVLSSVAFVNGGDAAPRNRPALAQTFEQANGGRVVVVVNHFKSKGSACSAPDAGDGQGECNAVRVAAASALRDWLATDPTDTGDPDVLILGDLNAYAMEDPIRVLRNAGYLDMVQSFGGMNAYSYVFDGQWGYLDHALASPGLAPQITGVTDWHINADEPSALDYNTNFKSTSQLASLFAPDQYRVSDHDPVLVGLNLAAPVPFGGFQAPIEGGSVVNSVNAPQTIPIKFSLGGNLGLDIFAAGFPRSRPIDCTTGAVIGASVAITSPGNSGLSYSGGDATYHINWKTDKAWRGSCRELLVRFNDGSTHTARFSFR